MQNSNSTTQSSCYDRLYRNGTLDTQQASATLKDIKAIDYTKTCAICLEQETQMVVPFTCNHFYHKQCIRQLEASELKLICPVCRNDALKSQDLRGLPLLEVIPASERKANEELQLLLIDLLHLENNSDETNQDTLSRLHLDLKVIKDSNFLIKHQQRNANLKALLEKFNQEKKPTVYTFRHRLAQLEQHTQKTTQHIKGLSADLNILSALIGIMNGSIQNHAKCSSQLSELSARIELLSRKHYCDVNKINTDLLSLADSMSNQQTLENRIAQLENKIDSISQQPTIFSFASLGFSPTTPQSRLNAAQPVIANFQRTIELYFSLLKLMVKLSDDLLFTGRYFPILAQLSAVIILNKVSGLPNQYLSTMLSGYAILRGLYNVINSTINSDTDTLRENQKTLEIFLRALGLALLGLFVIKA